MMKIESDQEKLDLEKKQRRLSKSLEEVCKSQAELEALQQKLRDWQSLKDEHKCRVRWYVWAYGYSITRYTLYTLCIYTCICICICHIYNAGIFSNPIGMSVRHFRRDAPLLDCRKMKRTSKRTPAGASGVNRSCGEHVKSCF